MKKLTIILVSIFPLLVISLLVIGCQKQSDLRVERGIIVRKVEAGREMWGLRVERGLIFRWTEIMLFSDVPDEILEKGAMNLPHRFRQEGLQVECTYTISDVIGSSNQWDTVIKIMNIELLD